MKIFKIFLIFFCSFYLEAEEIGEVAQKDILGDENKEDKPALWENFLELGIVQFQKGNKKDPEDLGSVLSSIRIANQFLSQEAVLSLQETEVVEKKPKRVISYSIVPKDSKIFFNLTYKFYDNRLEYRRYYDTQENFTLDTYINDYKESKIKFGVGPLDYFTDSSEVSFYYFQIETRGTYEIQTRKVSASDIGFAGGSTLSYFFYNFLKPSTTPLTYYYGTNHVRTQGIGLLMGWNTKFWKIFSIYNIFDFQMFRIDAKLSNLSQNAQFYSSSTKQYQYVPQMTYVEKNLDSNLLMYYELGFSITIGKIGFKWGIYWTLPMILDTDSLEPKGYVITFTNPIQIQTLESEVKIFYKGDPSNHTETFQIGLGGTTFGFVSKF